MIQQELTANGTHGSAVAVDLVIAATAQAHGLIVLWDDPDYLTITKIYLPPSLPALLRVDRG